MRLERKKSSTKNIGEICVVGVGAATAVGATAQASAAAVRAGVAWFGEHPHMTDKNGDPYILAMAPFLDENLSTEDRLGQLSRMAAEEALNCMPHLKNHRISISYILGLPEFRPGFSKDTCKRFIDKFVGTTFGEKEAENVQEIPNGHSAGLMAVMKAEDLLKRGKGEFCLAGGAESYIHPETLDWLEECDQYHNPNNAWGFIPGEGAGFLLLCLSDTATKYGLPILGRFMALSLAREENRIKTETVCIGEGLTQAVREVLASFAQPGKIIDLIICDQNGEAYRADEYGFMLARTSERFKNPTDFWGPVDCWGDVGAASGPLLILLAIAAAQKGYGKGPNTLIWTSSEGGARACAIFQANIQAGAVC